MSRLRCPKRRSKSWLRPRRLTSTPSPTRPAPRTARRWGCSARSRRNQASSSLSLPRTRDTLLLRMLGADRVLAAALADMEALPDDAWEKSVADPLLLHFRLAKRDNSDTTKEDEVNAEIRAWYEEYQREQQKLRTEARDNGRNEGRNEGRAEEAARAVLTALRVRGIAVPEAARARILAEKDPERLERWHERAIVAASIVEVIDEPS